MDFKDLINGLSEQYCLLSSRSEINARICGIEWLDNSNTYSLQDDVVYVVKDSTKLNRKTMPRNLIWSGDMTPVLSEMVPNWIQIEQSDLMSAMANAKRMLYDSYRLQDLQIKTTTMLVQGDSLDDLLSEISLELNTTLVIMEMSGKVMAYSRPFRLESSMWLESVKQGFCPPYHVENVRNIRHRRQQTEKEEKNLILYHCTDGQLWYLAKQVYTNGELYGYIFMIHEDETFTTLHRNILDHIGRAVMKHVLNPQEQSTRKSNLKNSLLTDIFSGISKEQIHARILGGDILFPQKMCVAVICPRYFTKGNYAYSSVMRILKEHFPLEHQVYYNRAVVLIVPMNKNENQISGTVMTTLQRICDNEHLIIGISTPYTEVALTKLYYEQALQTCSLARRLDMESGVYHYKEFLLYDLIDRLPEDIQLGLICHPALKILQKYDRENDSQLFETLRAYTKAGFNHSQTAIDLFLHRNTLTYRRQKIVSLTGIDFDNIETQLMLHCSYIIDDYMKKTGRS